MKLLGWTEIECVVSEADGLQAELAEFKALCSRYVSGIESLHYRADIFAGMSISQFDALGDSAYSVTTAIKEFFEMVHEIRHEMEKEHES